MTEKDILIALQEAYRQAGTQVALAQRAGVSQGRIADYLNGRCSIGNMTVATLLKLFPEMSIDFFGGISGNMASDGMRSQLLEIFESLTVANRHVFWLWLLPILEISSKRR